MNSGPDTVGSVNGPNAHAIQMDATFWIEEVEITLTVKKSKVGKSKLLPPAEHIPVAALRGQIKLNPGRNVTKPTQVTFLMRQLQYTQTVFLNFASP